ncbi:MAG: peptidoglycan DD-metalloendopeptidase family protein [Thermomicrobiaceae bacterium]
MKVYRSGDPNHQKSVLKPLSSGAKNRPNQSSPKHEEASAAEPAPKQPVNRSGDDDVRWSPGAERSDPAQGSSIEQPSRFSWNALDASSHRVSVPIWLVAILAFAIIAGPTLTILVQWDRDGANSSEANGQIAEAPTATSTGDEEDEDLPLALESQLDPRQWDEPEPPAVSNREQYLMDQGVNPDFEVRYAADEVAQLQAELEAIQRNSSLLRSLAREQSGDLSAAYSSLEASEESADGAVEDFQDRIDDLEARIQTVDELAREIRDLLDLPPSESGMGGPADVPEDADEWQVLRADIVAMEQWVGNLIFDLDEANTEIQLRIARLEEAQAQEQAQMAPAASVSENIEVYDSTPMGWPVDGPITSRFGSRSSPFAGEGSATEMHTGIDISARSGTPVIATGGGTVQISGTNGGYGSLVVIDHGRGITSWYGHNSRLLVTPGQRVNAGDVIAEVGSTGRSTGPHVHYEVRENGVPLDPMPYMNMSR